MFPKKFPRMKSAQEVLIFSIRYQPSLLWNRQFHNYKARISIRDVTPFSILAPEINHLNHPSCNGKTSRAGRIKDVPYFSSSSSFWEFFFNSSLILGLFKAIHTENTTSIMGVVYKILLPNSGLWSLVQIQLTNVWKRIGYEFCEREAISLTRRVWMFVHSRDWDGVQLFLVQTWYSNTNHLPIPP